MLFFIVVIQGSGLNIFRSILPDNYESFKLAIPALIEV